VQKSSQIAWKLVPLRHFFPLKVVPLIEVLLYRDTFCTETKTPCGRKLLQPGCSQIKSERQRSTLCRCGARERGRGRAFIDRSLHSILSCDRPRRPVKPPILRSRYMHLPPPNPASEVGACTLTSRTFHTPRTLFPPDFERCAATFNSCI
jgi:hypothetical protein